MVKIVECPRDAMQGFHNPIPTEKKIEYLRELVKVGFDAIDCGSFVSAKAVPQLSDTSEVLRAIGNETGKSSLLTIVANERGGEMAAQFENVNIIGFPFSISETFQLRNTRQTIRKALDTLKNLNTMASGSGKQLLVYLSMGFGNPYGDEWKPELAIDWCKKLSDSGVTMINLSDTIGRAVPADIEHIFKTCTRELSHVEFGAHFHTRPDNARVNVEAAYKNGCRKFDSAIRGFGGCPFASDKLTGNLPTEELIDYLDSIDESLNIDREAFQNASALSVSVFI